VERRERREKFIDNQEGAEEEEAAETESTIAPDKQARLSIW
jgi:hypothetical protein